MISDTSKGICAPVSAVVGFELREALKIRLKLRAESGNEFLERENGRVKWANEDGA